MYFIIFKVMRTSGGTIDVRTDAVRAAGDLVLDQSDTALSVASSVCLIGSGSPLLDAALGDLLGAWEMQLSALAVVTACLGAALLAAAEGYGGTEAAIARSYHP